MTEAFYNSDGILDITTSCKTEDISIPT